MARHKEGKKPKGSRSNQSNKRNSNASSNASDAAAVAAGRVAKIHSAKDAGFTGQDAFGMGDDEIRLDDGLSDGDDADGLSFDEEDEVLALNLPSQNSKNRKARTDADGTDEPGTQKRNKRVLAAKQRNKDRDLLPLDTAKTSRFERPVKKAKPAPAVDYSAVAASDQDEDGSDRSTEAEQLEGQGELAGDSSEEDDQDQAAREDDLDDEDWMRAGGYHVSKREMTRLEDNAQKSGRRKSDRDAERDALELYEARRIQKEGKAALAEDDYGLDETEDAPLPAQEADLLSAKPATALAPARKFANRQDAIAHLVSTEPELLALLDDFSVNSERLGSVRSAVKNMQIDLAPDNPKLAFGFLYQETLVTYLTTLAFYLHVRSHPSYLTSDKEVAESALGKLVKLRQAISSLDDLGVVDVPGESRRQDVYQDGESDEDDGELALEELDRETLLATIGDLDDDELDALIAERQAIVEQEGLPTSARSKRKNTADGEDAVDLAVNDAASSKAGSRKLRRRKDRDDSVVQMDLLNLAPVTDTAKANHSSVSADTDLLDPTALSSGDASEKAGRSKSLRFYTSKIDSKSAKRSGAGKERAGGDDDVPYRSKERARAAALQRQQHNQETSARTELDDEDFLDADLQDAREVVTDADAEGYYDLVVKGKQAAKAGKQQAYEDAVSADRAANALSQPLDPNNPRAVNRMIMANKGLTPKRPKSVRNPRVKKRMRYDQAQKKVASMKPVYKGGLGSASYEGEKSGISSKVVKSRSL